MKKFHIQMRTGKKLSREKGSKHGEKNLSYSMRNDASVDSFSGAIRVHMSSLRRKLKAVLGHDVIMNKVGEGYKIREESDR